MEIYKVRRPLLGTTNYTFKYLYLLYKDWFGACETWPQDHFLDHFVILVTKFGSVLSLVDAINSPCPIQASLLWQCLQRCYKLALPASSKFYLKEPLNLWFLNALHRGAAGDDLTSYEGRDEHGRHNQDDCWSRRTIEKKTGISAQQH